MAETIISSRNLHLYYGKKEALKGINLDIYKGEITAMIGPSGCGKSTYLRSLNRMNDLIPNVTITGSVMYKGKDIYSPKTDTVELRKEIGMVFQQPNPFPFSIYENVVYGLRLKGVNDKQILDKVVEESLKAASVWDDVKDKLHQSALSLSGGQQQRVPIARAVVTDCKLLLADEPTGNLDSVNGVEVMELLRELNRQGTTIIIVTHSQRDATYAHRIIRLLDGKIVAENINRPLDETSGTNTESV